MKKCEEASSPALHVTHAVLEIRAHFGMILAIALDMSDKRLLQLFNTLRIETSMPPQLYPSQRMLSSSIITPRFLRVGDGSDTSFFHKPINPLCLPPTFPLASHSTMGNGKTFLF